jgi:hypothetical protein
LFKGATVVPSPWQSGGPITLASGTGYPRARESTKLALRAVRKGAGPVDALAAAKSITGHGTLRWV